MFAKGLHPGAIWHKCDFQIHTPRDAQWKGSISLPGGTDAEEAAREEWADAFVAACVGRGLSVIAITDHHDFCFVEYVQRAIARLGQDLWLFPGTEVTCNDSVQCLLLFDVGTNTAALNRIFGGHLQNVEQVHKNEAQAPQTNLCGKDIASFIEGVASDSSLSRRSIILPNASDGGYKTILRGGFHVRFRELPFDGVYVDGGFDAVSEVARNKIYGVIEEWGNRRRGILPTGDNRHASWEKLGAHPCWVRLGEPTTEAIRQAVLADEARITYREPQPPTQRVIAMDVTSTLLGENFRIVFNDGFNTVIGGRGSGKSAILEYLRFGLGRAAADIVSDVDEVRSREHNLIENTLESGYVKIDLIRDGVKEAWSRQLSKRDSIQIALSDGTIETISIGAAQQRFRARAFYQKQLSTLVSDERSAAEQITGIAAAESVDKLRTAEQELSSAKRQVQRFFAQYVEYWILEATLTRDRDRTNDIKRRIEAVRKKLEESGIKPETQKVLDEAPLYASTADLVQEAAQGIESDANKLRELKAAIPSINTESLQKAKAFPETSTFLEEVDIARATVATALDTALDAMMRLDGAQHIYAKDFERTFRGFKEKHADAVKLQANVSNLVEELQRLNSELQAGEAAERRSSSSLKSLERLPAEFNSARTFLDTKVAMLRELLSGAATQVMAMSGSILEALVQAEDIPQQYVSSLASLCEGSRIRDPESRCQGIVELLPKETQRQAWNAIANKILEIHRYKVQKQDVSAVDVSEEIRRELQFVFGELTAQQANTIYSRIDIPTVSEILTATVGAFVGFNYKDSSGLIPFKQASPGQQASALLHLLLHQQAGTLIIDQPEDDLDNRTIMGIVRLLQTTKQQRQLIFATHNPNFVVNGDADKVIALVPDSNDPGGIGQKRISIDADGAIETESVRIAITEVMEGGEAAFELRSRKYQFR